ncbi:glycosyltransferase family 31 protein [Myriangium duriaei CBS 260.36]|uniref:N-acetylgalactosaminide beta-1,3-galactosyltransferase n=1 Tax=Myriangium duriaei CBS 260.36 TaxID=1168546 RepID=A0A9P4J4C5_9PEZI|nr:glycosyltransferase family 31 protein [Myriangium duriaei CBS 260.36]
MRMKRIRSMTWAVAPAKARRFRALFTLASCLLCLLYFSTVISGLGRRRYDLWIEQPYIEPLSKQIREGDSAALTDARCASFPSDIFDKTQIIVKIGAPEAHTKLIKQLATNTACVKDLLIFSDFEEEIQGHHVYDALSGLKASEWAGNPDHTIYNQIKIAKNKGKNPTRSIQGWKLDKYKFLPMMDMTSEMRPQKDWYIFIEADSYIFWDNLFRWLAHLDPAKELYMGSPVWRSKPRRSTFAHGGSGIVLSRAGLERLVRPPGYDCVVAGCTQYGFDFKDKCCGDEVLSDVFNARGIPLAGYWPMLNGEKPSTVRYGRDEQWCEPVIIMHHINETDQAEIWDWELRRSARRSITFEDLWEWQEHLLTAHRKDWTILPEGDVLKAEDGEAAAASAETCKDACADKKWCYQWQYTRGVCEMSRAIRVGREQLPEVDGHSYISGTIMEQVVRFKQRMGHCEDAHWVRPNPG